MTTGREAILNQKRAELAVLQLRANQTVNSERLWVLDQRILRLKREIAELEQQHRAESDRIWTMLGSSHPAKSWQ